jgi:carboxymethylenebutenolidase
VGEHVEFPSEGGAARCYLATPDHGSAGPALIVLGPSLAADVDAVTTCDQFAAEGFTAAAPELIAPTGADPVVLGVNVPVLVDLLRGVVSALEAHPRVHGRGVGVYGSGGAGGRLALAMAGALADDVRACVIVDAPVLDDNAAHAWVTQRAPVEVHYGLAGVPSRRDELDRLEEGASQVQVALSVFTYAGAAPGFTEATSPAHDPDAAHEAFIRTLAFLRAHLG